MKNLLSFISDNALKFISASAAVGCTLFNLLFANDTLEFYSHYLTGMLSMLALIMVFDGDF